MPGRIGSRAPMPDIISIAREARAAGYDVSVARAGRLPTVSGVVSGDYVNTLAGSPGVNPVTLEETRSGTSSMSVGYRPLIPFARVGST